MSSVSLNSNNYNAQTSLLKKTEDKKAHSKTVGPLDDISPIDKKLKSTKVEISDKALELKEELTNAEKAKKIQDKKFGNLEKPGIYFVSGFDWFGAGSIKGNYDGIKDMSEAIDESKHYSWDQQDEIIEDIKKRKSDQPIILVGHSFGGDGIMEIAERLNTLDNGFRKIDLLVTLDSVGYDNDKVPHNVKKNINYIAQGPYNFLNDGPNIALDYKRTKVENFLRSEKHAELDDATDIQINVLESVQSALANNLSYKKPA